MPLLKDRDRHEAGLATEIEGVFEDWGKDVRKSLSLLVSDARREGIRDEIGGAWIAAAFEFSADWGWPDEKFINESRDGAINRIYPNLESLLISTYQKRIRDYLSRNNVFSHVEITDQIRDQLMSDILNRSNAERIAATEITRIATTTDLWIYDQAQRTFGVEMPTQQSPGGILLPGGRRLMQATWRAERKPCPVCGQLDGKPRSIWGGLFWYGPPAHPWCRCHISFE